MRRISTRVFLAAGLAVAVGLATALSPFASPNPDGLERVADETGFGDAGRLHSLQDSSPIPDYAFPGVDDPRLATGLAGFLGTLAVFAIGVGIAALLRRRHPAPVI